MGRANGGAASNRESSFYNGSVFVAGRDLSLKVVWQGHYSHLSGWPSRLSNVHNSESGYNPDDPWPDLDEWPLRDRYGGPNGASTNREVIGSRTIDIRTLRG